MPEGALFNRADRIAEGWHWLLRSEELRPGQVRPVELMGKALAVFRGQDGKVRALDAHCPHMGAHLAEGKVEGRTLRCFFHGWRYDGAGRCVEVPSLAGCPLAAAKTVSWPVEERYGLVWIWTGPEARGPVPFAPELEGLETAHALGGRFEKNCQPGVMLINAIDEHHFNTVHRLPVELYMQEEVLGPERIRFSNATRPPDTRLGRLFKRFYRGAVTYSMCYWYGGTGTVTLGPDFLHFYILFALRPRAGGGTVGQTVLLTRARPGLRGRLLNRALLFATRLVGGYFAHGDTKVFQTIRFDLRTPVKADHAVLALIRHTDGQRVADWGHSKPEPALEAA